MSSLRWLEALWVGVVVVGGLVLLASLVPVRVSGGTFSAELAAEFPGRARLVGVGLVAWGGVLWLARSTLASFLAQARCEARGFAADAALAARRTLIPRGRVEAVALAVIAVSAVGLRLAYIRQPIRNDEAITAIEFAFKPVWIGLSYYPAPNNHLFHTLLVHAATVLFGQDVWALRIPALLAGLLVVPATLVVGSKLYGRTAGLLAAALTAVSSILIDYSTNARGYTLLALFFVLMVGCAAYAARTNNAAAWFTLALLGFIGLWTVPTMLYAVATIGAYLVSLRASRQWLLPAVLVMATLAGLVYVPPALVSGLDRILANQWVTSLDLAQFPQALLPTLLATWQQWTRDIPAVLAALLAIGVILQRGRIALAALVACLALVIVQRVAPFDRVWLFLLPAFFMEAAAGLTKPRAPKASWAAVLAAVITLGLGAGVALSGSVLASDETGVFPEAEALSRGIATEVDGSTAVQTCVRSSLPELQYYFYRQGLDGNALVRPSSGAAKLLLIVHDDVSECTTGIQGSRPIDFDFWTGATTLGTYGSVKVLQMTARSSALGCCPGG